MCILYDKLYLFARKVCEHLSISVFMVKKNAPLRTTVLCSCPYRAGKQVLVVVTVNPHVVDDFLLVVIVFRVIVLTATTSASVVAKNHCGY